MADWIDPEASTMTSEKKSVEPSSPFNAHYCFKPLIISIA
jgi:hypothetical protein